MPQVVQEFFGTDTVCKQFEKDPLKKAEPTINVPGRPGREKEYAIDLKDIHQFNYNCS